MARLERDFGRVVLAGSMLLTSCASNIEAKKSGTATFQSKNPVAWVTPTPPERPEIVQTEIIQTATPTEELTDPSLEEFKEIIKDGKEHIVGVYTPGAFAIGVVQQPPGDLGFISPYGFYFTQFTLDKSYQTTGFLAHNYTEAGKKITLLGLGQKVFVINGKGETESYTIDTIIKAQALQPLSPWSNFIDLETGDELSGQEMFNRVYVGKGKKVVFQTCIERDGNDTWGRLFVIGR